MEQIFHFGTDGSVFLVFKFHIFLYQIVEYNLRQTLYFTVSLSKVTILYSLTSFLLEVVVYNPSYAYISVLELKYKISKLSTGFIYVVSFILSSDSSSSPFSLL